MNFPATRFLMYQSMTSTQRVNAALDFQQPDFIPLFDLYWGGFINAWRERHGLSPRRDIPLDDVVYDDEEIYTHFHVDMYQVIPNEDPWPSQNRILKREGRDIIQRDGWGRVVRRKETSPYGLPLEVHLQNKAELDQLEFESPALGIRYDQMLSAIKRGHRMVRQPYLFLKIGGPFLRPSFLRGDFQWYIDIAEDPVFAGDLAERMTDHLIAVGVEALNRCGLPETSIWIYDDIASNNGLLISPQVYERLFLPLVSRMVRSFKAAGARHVGYHSDGDIREILDGLVEVGISILNPIEPRANMDVVKLRGRYGAKLALVGGLCNSVILPAGSDSDVRRHVDRVLSVGGEGGLVIGTHSVSNEVTQDRYAFVMERLHQHGRPLPGELTPSSE
jgi:uroporphyrinogen decarboxylase